MRRRTRTNLFLFATVGLLVIAVFAEFRRERMLERDALTAIRPDDVKTLVVTCQGCTTRRFEKENGHWMMRAPQSAPANDKAVARLAAIANAPMRYRQAAADFDAGKLGLVPPVATLQLDGTLLKFGMTDAIHNDRYVEVGGMIGLVPDRFSALLFATPESELEKASSPSASSPPKSD